MRLKDHFYVEIDEDGNEVLVTETYVDYGESDTPILDKLFEMLKISNEYEDENSVEKEHNIHEKFVEDDGIDSLIEMYFKGEIPIDAIADYCNQNAYSQEEREYALEVIMSSDFQEICNSIFDSAKNKKVKGVYKDILFE